jgi:hypothetical protein
MTMMRLHNNNGKEARLRRGGVTNHNHTRALLERVLLPGLLLSLIIIIREAWLRARGLSSSSSGGGRRQEIDIDDDDDVVEEEDHVNQSETQMHPGSSVLDWQTLSTQ